MRSPEPPYESTRRAVAKAFMGGGFLALVAGVWLNRSVAPDQDETGAWQAPTQTNALTATETSQSISPGMEDWVRLDNAMKAMRSGHMKLDPGFCKDIKTDEAHLICLQQVVDFAKQNQDFQVFESACSMFRENHWQQTCRMDLIDTVRPESPYDYASACREWAPIYLMDCLIHANEYWLERAVAGNPAQGMDPSQVVATHALLAGLVGDAYAANLADSLSELIHLYGGTSQDCNALARVPNSGLSQGALLVMLDTCRNRTAALASGKVASRTQSSQRWK